MVEHDYWCGCCEKIIGGWWFIIFNTWRCFRMLRNSTVNKLNRILTKVSQNILSTHIYWRDEDRRHRRYYSIRIGFGLCSVCQIFSWEWVLKWWCWNIIYEYFYILCCNNDDYDVWWMEKVHHQTIIISIRERVLKWTIGWNEPQLAHSLSRQIWTGLHYNTLRWAAHHSVYISYGLTSHTNFIFIEITFCLFLSLSHLSLL